MYKRQGLYRGIWRFASVPDLLNILKASMFGLLAILFVLFIYNRLGVVPVSYTHLDVYKRQNPN